MTSAAEAVVWAASVATALGVVGVLAVWRGGRLRAKGRITFNGLCAEGEIETIVPETPRLPPGDR